MNTNSKYNFQEARLGPDFAKEKLKSFTGLINAAHSFTVVSMPGVGVSYFLKYLVCQSFARFIHIDLYNLPTLSQHEFYRMFLRDLGGKPTKAGDEQVFLEIKAILKRLAEKEEKVVIIFSRFDQLQKDLDENFLSNLQSLTTIVPGKIVLIFTAVKPLYELVPEAVAGGNLSFYSKILYFKPFSHADVKKLFLLEHTQKAHLNLDEMIKLSGGHIQLLNVFNNSQKLNNLLLDKFVTLQLKDLYDYLDYSQKKDVQKVVLGKHISEVDEYLLGVGMIRESTSGEFELFSPVLAEYIKTNLPKRLPVKEKILFKILRKNMGKVVSKDEIFSEVWPARNALARNASHIDASGSRSEAGGGEIDENATDWALDALIYRLRKHPFMKAHGYIIESHKKVGYTLIQA